MGLRCVLGGVPEEDERGDGMSQCKWCGVERDAPALGPHVCDPMRVRELAICDAVDVVQKARADGETDLRAVVIGIKARLSPYWRVDE